MICTLPRMVFTQPRRDHASSLREITSRALPTAVASS